MNSDINLPNINSAAQVDNLLFSDAQKRDAIEKAEKADGSADKSSTLKRKTTKTSHDGKEEQHKRRKTKAGDSMISNIIGS